MKAGSSDYENVYVIIVGFEVFAYLHYLADLGSV